MKPSTERRRKPRVAANFDLRLDGNAAPAQVRDISASGVRCLTDRPFALMTQVQLVLVIPNRTKADGGTREIVCRGAVVRSQASAENQAHGGKDAAGNGKAAAARSAGVSKTSGDPGSRLERSGAGAAATSPSLARFDTAIFFTDMKDTDRADVEEFVSRTLRSSRQ